MNVETSPESPKSPPLSRQQMIAERQRRSSVWRLIHILGSLNFALTLLATIAILCAAATFTESGFSTKVARAYFYRNPLFLLWLFALCINLFSVTLTRWPWQKKHTGFIVTHYGIITLLIGAMVGMQTGYEGNVTLHKGTPVSRITTSRSIIQLESPSDSALYITGYDAETAKPSSGHPNIFPVPGSPLSIVVDDFSSNLITEKRFLPSDSAVAAPAVLLKLSSKMASQTLEMPFTLTEGASVTEDFFGLASIAFLTKLPPESMPADQETQMVFAKYAPIVQSGSAPTKLTVQLTEDGEKVTIISPNGTGATYLRKEMVGVPITEAGTLIVVEKYWSDFGMKNGQPFNQSPATNNPAILVRISGQGSPKDSKPILNMAPAGDHVSYQLSRQGHTYARGSVAVGEKFALGWADWEAEVLQVLPKAELVSEIKPGPDLAKGIQGIPGFRAHLVSGTGQRGPDRWIESGEVISLTDSRNVVRIGYGLETKPLPFSIQLVNFEVPRDEGTDTPADFRASVEFQDAKTGAKKSGLARMNNPASFPGTFWANVTGINYKFSQAEWNPRDLDETTLQVLYDPGWMLKWIGSLGICIGIGIMFYWKPR